MQNLDEFLAQKIECKVIELNRSRNNVVLSRRAVLEEERKEVRQQILDRLQPGQVVEGAISNIVDFGAFVDLDGIDGLIHISELSWSHVNHPSEILSIGDTVPVKVLDIDRDRQRISLGLKQTQEDPWQRVVDTYSLGDELEGKVTKVVTFGAFVEIMEGVEGLVHISELAHHHVENPREVVEPGGTVKVKILEVDSDRRRLSLSVKRVAGNEPPPRAEGEGGAPAPGAPDLGEVRDLGLSDDVFAGPDVSGAGDLRAAVAEAEAAQRAADEDAADADEPSAGAAVETPAEEPSPRRRWRKPPARSRCRGAGGGGRRRGAVCRGAGGGSGHRGGAVRRGAGGGGAAEEPSADAPADDPVAKAAQDADEAAPEEEPCGVRRPGGRDSRRELGGWAGPPSGFRSWG